MPHECVYKDTITKIDDKQDMIATDVAIIKDALIGNGKEGYFKKTDRHEKYWQMTAGGATLIGFALAVVKAIN